MADSITFPREALFYNGTNPVKQSVVERNGGNRYGNTSKVRLEVRYGKL